MTVTIRLAEPSDAAILHEVAAATFPLACPPHTTDEAKSDFIARHLSTASFDGYLADPDRELLLALDDESGSDRAVGYTMLVHTDPTDPDVAAAVTARPTSELSKIYVLPDAHGGGIATQLMQRSIELTRARGAITLWLGVNEENERANRFYEKHGFKRVGMKRFLVGERWEDDYVRELVVG